MVQELVVVGERARLIGEAAIDGGLRPAQVHFIDEAPAALPLLRELIQPADFVLVKGSLGMRMDRIVTELREDS